MSVQFFHVHLKLIRKRSASQVEVQDTVGCGDSFASAIVFGYINKHSIPRTLALANALGAATATGRGAGRNVASASKVRQLLRQAIDQHRASGQDGEGDANEEALEMLNASLVKKYQQVM